MATLKPIIEMTAENIQRIRSLTCNIARGRHLPIAVRQFRPDVTIDVADDVLRELNEFGSTHGQGDDIGFRP